LPSGAILWAFECLRDIAPVNYHSE